MINIDNDSSYYLEGNIGSGETCEYVSTNAQNHLLVSGEGMPDDSGYFLAEQDSSNENNWAFKDTASEQYLTRDEANGNAQCTSTVPVYFVTVNADGGDDVFNISQETQDGDQLYLSMLNTEVGSQITFAEYKDEDQSKQKWKFVKKKGVRDVPGGYGG